MLRWMPQHHPAAICATSCGLALSIADVSPEASRLVLLGSVTSERRAVGERCGVGHRCPGGVRSLVGDLVSGRCVCGHGKFLHRKGVCFAKVNPCGCTSYETPSQADKPSGSVKHTHYEGFYANKRYSA